MKQGSTDDPFAEDPAPSAEAVSSPEQAETSNEKSLSSNTAPQSPSSQPSDSEDTSRDTSEPRILPYIYKRGAVKEGRTQRPVYLREYNEDRIPELIDAVEEHLGEEVTKTDLLEAAMETAIENPELVTEILRTERYGYDWE